ncbi:MAG: outer membrane lipoprotein-sorting protein [Desulfobacula sp.]|nr:outer membrane lipoprotein-sorting protein [Desulfobacula sp.]
MKKTICGFAAFIFIVSGLTLSVQAKDKESLLNAAQIIENSQLAFYYQGTDMKANVVMELIDKDGGKRVRVMTILRLDRAQGENQKYFIYFHKPGDVRRMTFMIWKYPLKDDDRWIFIPAIDLIKRIAADDKRSSFVGSDFTYEDISGRDVDSDAHTLLRSEVFQGIDSYLIQSLPLEPTEYAKRLSWIDKITFLPLKEEYYDAQEELFRVFTSDVIEKIAAGEGEDKKIFPTVTKRIMKNVKTGHRTKVIYKSVIYNIGLKDTDFSERHMRRPPRSWIR